MSHKRRPQHQRGKSAHPDKEAAPGRHGGAAVVDSGHHLGIVLKCDAAGSLEAVTASMQTATPEGVQIDIVHAGIGDISKSDLFLAAASNRLIVGFNVGTNPQITHLAGEHGVEIRLYNVIYRLLEDIGKIAASLLPGVEESKEEIIGTAKVIALFKSSRKGIILGCEVQEGELAVGRRFRVITAMGPVYRGRIESLHIERDAVSSARKGQKVGLKIRDFQKVHIGDLVESYRLEGRSRPRAWSPQPGVIYR